MNTFNPQNELNNIIQKLIKIDEIEITLINNVISININKNIIKIYYDTCYHLYLKNNQLDTELITTEERVVNDVLHLIKLYN